MTLELWDDERDADGDGLSNWDEQRGKFTVAWWAAMFDGEPAEEGVSVSGLTFLDVEDLPNRDALAKPDMDGDGVLDGADDHDHDGLSNPVRGAPAERHGATPGRPSTSTETARSRRASS